MSDTRNNRNQYRKNYISYSDYVEGNAVRKAAPQEVPVREPRIYEGNQRIGSKALHKNREKALRMSAGYVAVLVVCCGLMAGVCAQYLSLRDEITAKKANIASMELNIEALKSQNDFMDYAINSYMDIEHISKVATEELGMVQAGKEQITFYNQSESEYMKQYSDVPSK